MDYKSLFTFTKQERKGIIFFIILIFGISIIVKSDPFGKKTPPEFLTNYYFPPDSTDNSDAQNSPNYHVWEENITFEYEKFRFNPNIVSSDSLKKLGFSPYGIKNLINYRSKGGIIYDDNKFKTIYGIDTNLINALDGYIDYGSDKTNKSTDFNNKKEFVVAEKELKIVEINSADSLSFVAIVGIGPYITTKILNMRTKTGGFIYKRQLVELNVLTDSLYQVIENQLSIDPNLIQKINVNTADFKTFIKHPYFSAETINAILKYRKQHGDFTNVAHISRIRSLKEEIGQKILPYLRVE